MDELFGSASAPLPKPNNTAQDPLPPNDPEPRPPDEGPPRRPRELTDDLRSLARLLYSHNPFYCISAFLVLWGLGKSFHADGAQPRPELLMTGLAAYAVLLAAVGCLLIRAGQLWEDIRTILLLVVLIFLAISMSFDEVLSTNQAVGRVYFLGGLAFAVVLSELVLRGVRLRLPALYRLTYYATLALMFLYPLVLGPWQDQDNDPHLRWLLAAFSPLAGLVTLTLLPAVRRGAEYVRNNGSPWQWPWYPWPLFVVLGVGVGLRTYAICVSFHPARGAATMFEPYFLVPLLFAVNVVLLEVGITRGNARLRRWMMAAPAALLALAMWTTPGIPDAINLRPMLVESIGCTPLFIALMAATLLYAVALLRRVPGAFHWLTAAVALLVVVAPGTPDLNGRLALHAWPLVLLAAMQLVAAVRTASGLHAMLAATFAIAAACIAWPQVLVFHYGGAIPFHGLLLAMLLIGALMKDRAAQVLQRLAMVAVAFACMYVMSGEAERCLLAPPLALALYPCALLLVAAAYGAWLRNRWYWGGALVMLTVWLLVLGSRGYQVVRYRVEGLDQIASGMACLLAGLLVSLLKLGIPQRWWARFWAWWWDGRPMPPVPLGQVSSGESH